MYATFIKSFLRFFHYYFYIFFYLYWLNYWHILDKYFLCFIFDVLNLWPIANMLIEETGDIYTWIFTCILDQSEWPHLVLK